MSFRGCKHLCFVRALVQVQGSIQRVYLEEIAMSARRWARTAISESSKTVCAVQAPIRELLCVGRNVFFQTACFSRNVIKYPMYPGATRRIRIVHDQNETLCALWWVIPIQWRGKIVAVTRMVFRNRLFMTDDNTGYPKMTFDLPQEQAEPQYYQAQRLARLAPVAALVLLLQQLVLLPALLLLAHYPLLGFRTLPEPRYRDIKRIIFVVSSVLLYNSTLSTFSKPRIKPGL